MSGFHIFDRRQGQLLTLGQHRFFIFRSSEGTEHMIPDKCPHRGGPLSRGHWDAGNCRLQCPWHNRSWPESALIKRQLPTIKVQSLWTVYLDVSEPGVLCRIHDVPVANIDAMNTEVRKSA